MLTLICLFWGIAVQATAQTAAPVAVVEAETIDSTMKQSIANNTLDKKVNETRVKGGIVRVGVIHRTRPETRALIHDDLTEIYSIVAGSGTLVTGGTPQDPSPASDPANLGSTPSYYVTQNGGASRKIKPKDVVIIPAGVPHRFSELDGPMEYVIYRFEVLPK